MLNSRLHLTECSQLLRAIALAVQAIGRKRQVPVNGSKRLSNYLRLYLELVRPDVNRVLALVDPMSLLLVLIQDRVAFRSNLGQLGLNACIPRPPLLWHIHRLLLVVLHLLYHKCSLFSQSPLLRPLNSSLSCFLIYNNVHISLVDEVDMLEVLLIEFLGPVHPMSLGFGATRLVLWLWPLIIQFDGAQVDSLMLVLFVTRK